MKNTTPATSNKRARATRPVIWPSGVGASRAPRSFWARPHRRWRAGTPAAPLRPTTPKAAAMCGCTCPAALVPAPVRVPSHAPTCGSPDIHPMGRGTEQLEEQLGALLSEVLRPDRTPARIARIDADTTKAKGALEAQLAQVHSGEVDVLVGTQMIAKGHDFRRI